MTDGSNDVFWPDGRQSLAFVRLRARLATRSHVRLRYEHPESGEIRNVDVPQHDEISIGTLRSIADQCGAEDFYEWCRWIDEHR